MSTLPQRDWEGWMERIATPEEIEHARVTIPEPRWDDPVLYEPWTLQGGEER